MVVSISFKMTAFNINEIGVKAYPFMQMNSSFLETRLKALQISLSISKVSTPQ